MLAGPCDASSKSEAGNGIAGSRSLWQLFGAGVFLEALLFST